MPSNESDGRRRSRLTGKSDSSYPVKVDLQYRLWERSRVPKTGTGRTVDISSSIISFESEDPLPPGRRINLIIPWPWLIRNRDLGLELHVLGRTARALGNRAVVEILRRDFRARALRAQTDEQRAGPDPFQRDWPCSTAQLVYCSAENYTRKGSLSDAETFVQVVATAGDYSIDLQIEPAFEEAEMELVGQVVNRTASGEPLAGAPVRLLGGGKLLTMTQTNSHGEFCLVSSLQSGRKLYIEMESPLLRVRVPLDKLTARFRI